MPSVAWIAGINRDRSELARWNAMTPAQQAAVLARRLELDIRAECNVCGNEFADHRPTSSIRRHRPYLTCPPERD